MEIVCQLCATVLAGPTENYVRMRGRAKGWRVYDGVSLTGDEVHVRLCPVCCKAPIIPRTPVLEGQIPLWGE